MRVPIAQNTEAWHAWRATGIGGSDAGTIMFESAYDSIYSLWAQKVGLRARKKENAAMKRGHELEAKGRVLYCKQVGEFLPVACMQHDEHKFMLASLDGYCEDLAFELKCPKTARTHRLVREGQIPRTYYAQCQHNLAVSGCKELHFVSYYPPDQQMPLAAVKVLPDEAYLRELIAAERTFWQWVTDKRFPEFADTGPLDLSDDPEWKDVAAHLWEARAMLEVAQEKVDELQGILKRKMMRAGVKKAVGAGLLAYWVHMKERVQTMPETVYLTVKHEADDGD